MVSNIGCELRTVKKCSKNEWLSYEIDNAMKATRSVREAYIGSASHKIERILKEVGIQVNHSSEDKLFRSLCTMWFGLHR